MASWWCKIIWKELDEKNGPNR